MKKILVFTLLFLTLGAITHFARDINPQSVNDLLKRYKIIASKPDVYYSYDQISRTYPWGLVAKADDVYFLTDVDGNKLNERGFRRIHSFDEYGLAKVENSDRMVGLINTRGELIADTLYNDIEEFGADQLAIVERQVPYTRTPSGSESQQIYYKHREGLIDTTGKLVIEPEYFNLTYLDEQELYLIDYYYYGEKLGSRRSLYSATKGWLENATYDSISPFKGGLAIVTKDGRDGLINANADIVIPPIYDTIFEASEGLMRVDNAEGQSAFFNRDGVSVIPFRDYRIPTHFKHGVSVVLSPESNQMRRQSALMDREGTLLTDYVFGAVEPFTYYEDVDSVLAVAGPHNSRFKGLINTSGDYVVEPKYSDIEYDRRGYFRTKTYVFSEDRSTQTKSFYYFTDLEGREFVELGYQNPTGPKPDGLGKLGILDNERNIIADPIYDDVRPDFDNTIKVQQGQRWGVINRRNETLLPIDYQAVEIFTPSVAFVSQNGHWGAYDLSANRLILPIEYDELEYVSLTHFNARQNDQWTTIAIQK